MLRRLSLLACALIVLLPGAAAWAGGGSLKPILTPLVVDLNKFSHVKTSLAQLRAATVQIEKDAAAARPRIAASGASAADKARANDFVSAAVCAVDAITKTGFKGGTAALAQGLREAIVCVARGERDAKALGLFP